MNVIFLIYIYTLCKVRGKCYIYFCFQAIKEGVCVKKTVTSRVTVFYIKYLQYD